MSDPTGADRRAEDAEPSKGTDRRPTDGDPDGDERPSSGVDGTAGTGVLSGLLLGGLVGSALTGTAGADSTGQVGTAGDPLEGLYTAELNGPVTDEGSGPQAVTSLAGDGLTVEAGALSGAPARPDVSDDTTTVTDAEQLSFGRGLTVTDEGGGTAAVELDTRWRDGPKLHPNQGEASTKFGRSVAVSGDGGTAIVGARTGDRAGVAYVFEEADNTLSSRFGWQTELTPDDGDDGDRFGESVALSADGTTALVGAPRDEDPNGDLAGSVYVFTDEGDGWSQQAKLTADDGDERDEFGTSLALSDDGTVALVGAEEDENPNGAEAGSAYVFADDGTGTWTQQSKIAAQDGQSNDRFGSTVSLSGDGSVALVGAPLDGTAAGDFAGSAYVFVEDVTGTNWSQQDKLTADDGDDRDDFGSAVALSDDGTTALVGAREDEDPNGNRAGSAYVFADSNDDGTWTQQTKLSASDGESVDNFGGSVALSSDGTTALVGAQNAGKVAGSDPGGVYVFVDDGGWSQQSQLFAPERADNNRFGTAVALSDSGETALVGEPLSDGPNPSSGGSAHLFRDSSGDGSFNLLDSLTAVDGDGGDDFGGAVALSTDGTTVLVGAPRDEDPNGNDAGSAYVFVDDGTGWMQRAKLAAEPDGKSDRQDRFGDSVALSADGTTALVAAPRDEPPLGAQNEGGVYVFADDGTGWSQQTVLRGDGESTFGESVALSADGTTTLVGSPRESTNGNGAGAAYVFVDDGGWSRQETLTADDGDDFDRFGNAVALSADGTGALVGARGDEDPNGQGAGSAYVFTADDSGTWTQQDKFVAGDAGDGDDRDGFGESVALSDDGSTALVGTRRDEDPNGQGAGSAYAFTDDGTGTWTQQDKLVAADGDDRDKFGRTVALSGDATTALVGARTDEDPNGRNAGSAYLFVTNGTDWTQQEKRTALDGDDSDEFGAAVALSSNGGTALVGAPRDENPNGGGSGSAYLFYETI